MVMSNRCSNKQQPLSCVYKSLRSIVISLDTVIMSDIKSIFLKIHYFHVLRETHYDGNFIKILKTVSKSSIQF
jgi:hypothetical protein